MPSLVALTFTTHEMNLLAVSVKHQLLFASSHSVLIHSDSPRTKLVSQPIDDVGHPRKSTSVHVFKGKTIIVNLYVIAMFLKVFPSVTSPRLKGIPKCYILHAISPKVSIEMT